MTESVSGFGPRPADDYVRGAQVAQKCDTPPALKVGPGSAGPTPAPQPVPKDPRGSWSSNFLAYGSLSAKFYCGWDILLQGNARGSFIVRVCRASVGVGIGAASRLSAPTSLKH
jgi:hypothetical protein